MHRALLATVVVLSVLAAGVLKASGEAPPLDRRGEKNARLAEPPTENPRLEATGIGTTTDEAEADALKHACDQVSKFLAEQEGDTNWRPTPSFLRDFKAYRLLGKPEKIPFAIPGEGENFRVKLVVELTPDVLGRMQQMVREQRMGERQRIAARTMAGILAVLVVLFGYLKLEDATKGYYSALLRLAALAVLIMTALGLWKLG
jgi:hypothetical protein